MTAAAAVPAALVTGRAEIPARARSRPAAQHRSEPARKFFHVGRTALRTLRLRVEVRHQQLAFRSATAAFVIENRHNTILSKTFFRTVFRIPFGKKAGFYNSRILCKYLKSTARQTETTKKSAAENKPPKPSKANLNVRIS